MCHKNLQKGTTAIFFAVIVTAIILGIAFGMSTLLFGGLSIQQGSGLSTIAYYAAEAGVEHIFFEDKNCHGDAGCLQNAVATTWGPGGVVSLSNGTTYTVDVEDAADCTGPSFCATSIGTFGNVVRTIDVTRRIFLLPCGEEIDVMMVFDHSDSVDSFKMADLQDAAQNFLTVLDPTILGTHAGIETFSDVVNLLVHLTGDSVALQNGISSFPAQGMGPTNLQGAIQVSRQELANPGDGHDRLDTGPLASPDYIIIVTDGDPTFYTDGAGDHDCTALTDGTENYNCRIAARAAASTEADDAKTDGSTIFVLGIGIGSVSCGVAPDPVIPQCFTQAENEDLLRSIASSPAHYASVSDYSVLEDALTNLCGG